LTIIELPFRISKSNGRRRESMTDTMTIVPTRNIGGSSRTGTLYDINVETINKILGFEPNVDDDPDKVVNSWGFMVDDKKFGIWDYKGSHHFGQFSTYGDPVVLEKLFGTNFS